MIGLSVGDFEEMDSDEFSILCKVFGEREEQMRRDAWERARIIGTLSVSPYVKGSAKPQRILPLPWDKEAAKPRHTRQVSKEEDKKRLESLMSSLRGKETKQ